MAIGDQVGYFQIDTLTNDPVDAGFKFTLNQAGSGVGMAVVSSGTNENLTIDAKGSGTITIGGTSTGAVVLGTGGGGITNGSTLLVPWIHNAAPEALTTAGAISVATFYTSVNTTSGSGHADTLADGTLVGQLKKIQLIVDGGDLVVTVSSLEGGNTITFADAGDYALLVWNGTNWRAVELGNDADGATAPAISTV